MSPKVFEILFISSTLITSSLGINCPTKVNKQDFSVSQYMGLWYEAYSFGANNYNDDNKCPKEYFHQERNNITIKDSSEILKEPGEQNIWPGYVTLAGPGQLVVHQDFGNGNIITYTLDVLDTDYTNWAVVWSCPAFNDKENSWIMTRKRLNYGETLPTEQVAEISEVLRNKGLKWSEYTRSPNYNCKF